MEITFLIKRGGNFFPLWAASNYSSWLGFVGSYSVLRYTNSGKFGLL